MACVDMYYVKTLWAAPCEEKTLKRTSGMCVEIAESRFGEVVISQWLPTTISTIDLKTHTIMNTSLEDMMKQLLANVQQIQDDFIELQHSNSKWKDLGTQFSQVNATLENMIDKEELSRQLIFNLEENLNTDTSKTVMLDELSIMDEYWSDPPETLEGVDVKERSQVFNAVDTFVSDDHNATKSFVLEVLNVLINLKEGKPVELPKAIDALFVVDISKGEGIT
ncbi:hypothetical protein Sjap_020149 [Stephania japonica]|uniref:Uncharacterized protein n=1 Tax=Stephania japonica TaxID=461633 RepID=A0AAP0F048_9MAGN